MKQYLKKFWLLAVFSCMLLPVSASGLGDIRVNARFLTDRMAFELHLNQNQYNDLFEVNFDFLSNVTPYLSGMARADAAALDAYYRFLDERNDDLRWILSSPEYVRFMGIEYFFRPVSALNNVCYLRIYKVYTDYDYFYFSRPKHSTTLFVISDDGAGNWQVMIDGLASYEDYRFFPYLADCLRIHLQAEVEGLEDGKTLYQHFDEEWISLCIGEEIAWLKATLSLVPRYYLEFPVIAILR